MAVRTVRKMGDPVLLQRAAEVEQFDTPGLHALIQDMHDTMEAQNGAGLMNARRECRLKRYSTVGMGPCQGRMCAATVTELLADAQRRPQAEVGAYRLRAPIKPVPLSEIAALPHTPDAVYAVTGTHSEH